MIPFNKPYVSGMELKCIEESLLTRDIAGNGAFTKKCEKFFEERFGFRKALMVTSCTKALEMCALLLDIKPGDEVIMPSYTFVSTANAFLLYGAKIVFADSEKDTPNLDVKKIEALITPRTKAIVAVHYASIACDMDAIMDIAARHKVYVVEDAAQSVDTYYKGRPLGSIGHLAAFSFDGAKNLTCGEGGLLLVNDDRFSGRADIIREKGTNRAAFFRGEVNKYGWMDIGSNFCPSELNAAFLYAQLMEMEDIMQRRRFIFNFYYEKLKPLAEEGFFKVPGLPEYSTYNGHIFYLVTNSLEERSSLIKYLKANGIHAVFHYLSLHQSPFFKGKHDGRALPNCKKYNDRLVRLPLFYELTNVELDKVVNTIAQTNEWSTHKRQVSSLAKTA